MVNQYDPLTPESPIQGGWGGQQALDLGWEDLTAGALPAYTPEQEWSQFMTGIRPQWRYRQPLQEMKGRLQARYMLERPYMEPTGPDYASPTFRSFLNQYAQRRAEPTGRYGGATVPLGDLEARAREASNISSMTGQDYLAYAGQFDPLSQEAKRADWYRSQYGTGREAAENRMALANLLALQRRGGQGVYTGAMADAIRNSMYELRAARQAQDQPGTFLDWYLGRRGGQGAGAAAGPAAAGPGAVVPPIPTGPPPSDLDALTGMNQGPTYNQWLQDRGPRPEILPDTPQGTSQTPAIYPFESRGRLTPEARFDPRSRLQFDPTIPPSQIVEDRDRLEFDPTLGPDPRSRLQFDPTIPSSQIVEDRSRLGLDPTLGPDPRSRLRTDPIITPEPDPRSRLEFDPTIPPLQVPPLPEDRSRLEFDPTLEPDPRGRLQYEAPSMVEPQPSLSFADAMALGVTGDPNFGRGEPMISQPGVVQMGAGQPPMQQNLPYPVRAPRPEMPTMPQPVGGLPPEVQLRGPEDRSRLEFDPTPGPRLSPQWEDLTGFDPRGGLRVEAPSPSAALWGGDTAEGEDRSRLQREVPIQSRAPGLLNAPINAFADFLRNHPGGGQGLLSQSLPALMRANPNAWAQIQASPSRQREIEQLAQGIPGLSPVEARARASRLRKLLGVYSGEEEEG